MNQEQIRKVIVGAVLAAAGAIAAYLTGEVIPQLKDSDLKLLLAAIVSILLNILRKLLQPYANNMNNSVLKSFFLVFLLSLLVTCVFANDALVIAPNGYYRLLYDNNNVVLKKFDSVVVLGAPAPAPSPGPAPTPTPVPVPVPPTPTPVPAPLTPRATTLKNAALQVASNTRTQDAAKLALLYSEVVTRVNAGQIKGQDQIAFVVKAASDRLVGAEWQSFRDVLTAEWTKLAQNGAPDSEYVALLNDASLALMAVSQMQQSGVDLQNLDLRTMLELIKVVIDILLQVLPRQ